jgi:Zn-dependent peptidase ImmA (M78 family)/transcriptional regulator with XRE-family HTH domain
MTNMKMTREPERSDYFVGGQLRLARHFWSMSLQDLADATGKSRQYVSHLEIGKARPRIDDPVVEAMGEKLEVLPQFFFNARVKVISEEQAHFRKLASTKVSTKHAILARGALFDSLVELIDSKVRLPHVDFPDLSGAHTPDELERAAERARIHYGLGLGPIAHMVRVVERAGAVVAFFEEASAEVDALSIVSQRPVIVRNDAKRSPGRLRFDIAHELGHLVLHEGQVTGDRVSENEANRFASAFLIPRSTYLKVFKFKGSRVDWSLLRELKLIFKVSKAALLYRARTLGLINEEQHRGAVITLKNRGEGVEEAEDALMALEDGEVLPQALQVLRNGHGMTNAMLANSLLVRPALLAKIAPLQDEVADLPDRPRLTLVR